MHLTRLRFPAVLIRRPLLLAAALLAPALIAQDAPAPAAPPAADADAAASPAPQRPSSDSSTSAQSAAPGGGQGQTPRGPGGEGGPRGPGGPGGFRGRFGGGGGGAFGGPGGGAAPMGGAPSALSETIRMEGDRVALQFPNNPVADMLSIYELLTGITLIKDTSIFEGAPVSLATPRAVPKDEAVKLIEAALLTNGYAIVMEPDGKSARILPARNQSANAVQFSHGVRFYTSAQDLPQGETIVTYFMRLDYLDPEEAGQMFSGHVGLSVYGRITPVLTPPGLLITESSTVVKQLISIREAIDVGDTGSSLVTKFIPVIYADASTIAQIIQATLTAQAQEKESKGISTIRGNAASDGRERREERQDNNNQPRPQAPMIINGQLVQPGNAQAPQPTAQVVADTRLNQILVVSSPADYAYIASLIAEFDKPLTVEEPYERKLQYASAVDVLSAIVDLLQDTSTGTTQLPGGGTIQQQRQQPLASSSSQLLTGRNTQNTRGGQVLSSTTSVASDSATTSTTTSGLGQRADVIQGPTEDNAPISVLVNKTRVVADPMSNTILVMGRKEDSIKVDGLLDKLDRKPAQVYLAAVIGQLTLGDDFQFGIDYIAAANRFAGGNFVTREDILVGDGFVNPPNTDNGLRAIRDLRNNIITTPFGPAKGLNLYGAIGNNLEVLITALESTNNFKVLSRPTVFTLNNKKASITSGTIIPVPGQTTVTNNNVITGVDYRDVVLKMEVVPLINPNGEVSLTISQVNDTVVGSQVIDLNEIPVIGTQQLITTVTVPSGKTIVLGGLIMDQKKKNTDGIPFLSRIPGVGNLFKENVKTDSRTELIIFIQPQVVTSDPQLYNASASEDYRTTIGAEAAKVFPGTIDSKSAPVMEVAPEEKKGFFSRLFKPAPKRP